MSTDGGGHCQVGDRSWTVGKAVLDLARVLSPLRGLTAEWRTREAARKLALYEGDQGHGHARALLSSLTSLARPLDPLGRAVIDGITGPLPPSLAKHIRSLGQRSDRDEVATALATWLDAWRVSPALGHAVMSCLRDVDPAMSLPLQAALWDAAALRRDGGTLSMDLDLAQHVLSAGPGTVSGPHPSVQQLLGPHLDKLADRGLDQILCAPQQALDDTSSDVEGGILETLARAQHDRGVDTRPLLA